MDILAPIVLFVYNRPEHTLRTLESLAKNTLAKDSSLYIFADGPKKDSSLETLTKIEETRKQLRLKKWCKEVYIIESETNKGLANSIIDGITDIINKYGRIIVLEDDIVTTPGFLQYMNDALDCYESESKVMHISAFLPYSKLICHLPETFLVRNMSCWGWATWKDRWDKLIFDTDYLYHHLPTLPDFDQMNFADLPETNMYQQIIDNYEGKIKTWAIKWYSTIFINQGLCLYPHRSLVKNIGFDGTGIHSGYTSHIYKVITGNSVRVKKIENIEKSTIGEEYFIDAYHRIQSLRDGSNSIISRIRNRFPILSNCIFRILKPIRGIK